VSGERGVGTPGEKGVGRRSRALLLQKTLGDGTTICMRCTRGQG